MAYQTIGTYKLGEWIQEEKIETQQVANPETGVVEEVTTVIQPYRRIWKELIVKQNVDKNRNHSEFAFEMWIHGTAGQNGSGFTMERGYSYLWIDGTRIKETDPDDEVVEVSYGDTKSLLLLEFSDGLFLRSNRYWLKYHYVDGIFRHFTLSSESDSVNGVNGRKKSFVITNQSEADAIIKDLFLDGADISNKVSGAITSITPTPLPVDRSVTPTTANSFTDEENPYLTYSAKTTRSIVPKSGDPDSLALVDDKIASLQAAISFDGVTVDIAYRDIPISGTSYTFNLTEAEREVLRQKAQGSDTVPIYYLIKVVREVGGTVSYGGYTHELETQSAEFVSATKRNLTIVGCNPTLNPTVKDIKLETLALTGDENTFVRYESMAEYAINATASKNATIVSQSVQCGSKTISNLPQGVIDDVESGTFIFNVIDSRNMGASSSVFKNLIEYVKPTCYQKVEIQISGETGAQIKVTVSGNYFNGSFGAVNNTLKLEVRYTNDDGDMGEWTTLTGTPVFNGTTYELEATFTGFNYGKAYVFQCRATDKLNFVESSQYTIRMMPVFDWSENDFNFNVPINIEAEDLNMHGETIIRHSDSTNNTVLSASSGNIYIRPGGTDNTYGETIFYGNGNVKFNGTVTFADGTTGGGAADPTDAFADYVIETGEEAMGSNGTWYWRKWASGKSEAWGCRNFGNMAVTTTWGNLYRSAIFTQDLPDDVFIRTPDAININIVHANFGGWICKHEQTAPSAVTTGSFIFVRPASATVSPTNLGFYIVGEWK